MLKLWIKCVFTENCQHINSNFAGIFIESIYVLLEGFSYHLVNRKLYFDLLTVTKSYLNIFQIWWRMGWCSRMWNRWWFKRYALHVTMHAIASQTTGVSIVCSIVGSDADQRKHQSSASLIFVREIHRWRHHVASHHRTALLCVSNYRSNVRYTLFVIIHSAIKASINGLKP